LQFTPLAVDSVIWFYCKTKGIQYRYNYNIDSSNYTIVCETRSFSMNNTLEYITMTTTM